MAIIAHAESITVELINIEVEFLGEYAISFHNQKFFCFDLIISQILCEVREDRLVIMNIFDNFISELVQIVMSSFLLLNFFELDFFDLFYYDIVNLTKLFYNN